MKRISRNELNSILRDLGVAPHQREFILDHICPSGSVVLVAPETARRRTIIAEKIKISQPSKYAKPENMGPGDSLDWQMKCNGMQPVYVRKPGELGADWHSGAVAYIDPTRWKTMRQGTRLALQPVLAEAAD